MRGVSWLSRSSGSAIAIAGLCALAPVAVSAQAIGAIVGIVADSGGVPISGAEIVVVATGETVRSDAAGRFRVGAPGGLGALAARRLGFAPITVRVEVKAAEGLTHLDIRMKALPTVLKPVVVRRDRIDYTGRLAGYYKRLETRNGGYFISRDQIDRENPRTLSQLLTHIPGINATRIRAGGGGVRMRGRTCWPIVWLDGLPMGAGEVDLDAFPPSTLQGIELYHGSTTAPLKYLAVREMSSCGTILLWSRGPDTDPPAPLPRPRFDIERMLASLAVYTSDQVDTPAAPDPRRELSVAYPSSLFAAGVGGAVVAEFVVDAAGRVEEGTFGIVSSTNPLLSEAVREAIQGAAFRPAVLHGAAVRQVVHQPFFFPARERKNPRG